MSWCETVVRAVGLAGFALAMAVGVAVLFVRRRLAKLSKGA